MLKILDKNKYIVKKYNFHYHFNKPKSQQMGCNYWSVHYRKKCYIVKDILCNVPCKSKSNKTQPKAVMVGKCANLTIRDEVAIIE